MFAVRGSGFGLYGYVPALTEGCDQIVILPERYRARFSERPELLNLVHSVMWDADDAGALRRASGAVVALPPEHQTTVIRLCLASPNVEQLLLEKPLAPSPADASMTLRTLVRSRRTFRVGYLFRHSSWANRLATTLRGEGRPMRLEIRWKFAAHHYVHDERNWKRFAPAGGGAIRFFGIHLIALLAEFGYREVLTSRALRTSADECEKWAAVVAGQSLPECDLVVDSRSQDRSFQVVLDTPGSPNPSAGLVHATDPFDLDDRADGFDRRVWALTDLCRSLWDGSRSYDWYEAAISLWDHVEAKTQFVSKWT